MLNTIENIMSYKSIQNSIRNFRSLSRDDFNLYDEPGTYWFKPIFYFYKSGAYSIDSDINNEGLLHPSWITESKAADWGDGVNDDREATRKRVADNNFVSSAYNYLKRNDENERATLLQRFIELLSNIASRSPWYFQEVTGLDTAIDRAEGFKSGKFVADDRKQITFTLLPDAVDDRIGTLIDLYRSVCYDWKQKREVVPSNLRKFDMGLYIFGSMIQNKNSNILHSRLALSGALREAEKLGLGYDPKREIVSSAGRYEYSKSTLDNTDLGTSNAAYSYTPKGQAHMYLEFINCEINISSTKGGDTISNAEGGERKYTLTIDYDDCYVNRYNDFILGAIGDILTDDIEEEYYGSFNNTTIGRPVRADGLLSNVVNGAKDIAKSSTLGTAEQLIMSTVGNVLLGNLYTGSLANSVSMLASGRVDALNREIQDLTNPNKINRTEAESKKSIYDKTNKPEKVKIIGNLYKRAGAASNL